MSFSPDVLIVGAGVSGLSAAHALARRGLRVSILDRGPLAHESTWAGAGILSLLLPWHYPAPVWTLAEHSRQLWPDWVAGMQATTGLDAEYRQSGLLLLAPEDRRGIEDWCARHHWRAGVPPAAIAAASALGHDALWLPEVAQVRNPRLSRLLEGALRQLGVAIHPNTPVTGLEIRNGQVCGVHSPGGLLAAGQVAICAGAWTPELLGDQVGALEIQPVRGQIVLLRSAPGTLPCIVYRDGRYLVPRADGRVLVGSTLEYAGFDKQPTADIRDALYQFAIATCPALAGAEVEAHWAGLRPGSPGNLPTIAPHPSIRGLYVNSGHFRYGLTMAPASAELLAELMTGNPTHLSAADYAWPTG